MHVFGFDFLTFFPVAAFCFPVSFLMNFDVVALLFPSLFSSSFSFLSFCLFFDVLPLLSFRALGIIIDWLGGCGGGGGSFA